MTVKLAIGSRAIGLCLGGAAVSVSAHHAFAAEFDANKPVEFSGTVTRMEWINPHVWMHLDVKKPDGNRRGVGVRGRDSERALPAGLHEGIADARDANQSRRLPGEGRHTARERSRPDVRRRHEAVPGVVGHGRSVRAGPPGRRHVRQPQAQSSLRRHSAPAVAGSVAGARVRPAAPLHRRCCWRVLCTRLFDRTPGCSGRFSERAPSCSRGTACCSSPRCASAARSRWRSCCESNTTFRRAPTRRSFCIGAGTGGRCTSLPI